MSVSTGGKGDPDSGAEIESSSEALDIVEGLLKGIECIAGLNSIRDIEAGRGPVAWAFIHLDVEINTEPPSTLRPKKSSFLLVREQWAPARKSI